MADWNMSAAVTELMRLETEHVSMLNSLRWRFSKSYRHDAVVADDDGAQNIHHHKHHHKHKHHRHGKRGSMTSNILSRQHHKHGQKGKHHHHRHGHHRHHHQRGRTRDPKTIGSRMGQLHRASLLFLNRCVEATVVDGASDEDVCALMCHAFLDGFEKMAQGLHDMAADDRILELLTPVADWSDYDMYETIMEHSSIREEFFATLCENLQFLTANAQKNGLSILIQRTYRAAAKIAKRVAHARAKAEKKVRKHSEELLVEGKATVKIKNIAECNITTRETAQLESELPPGRRQPSSDSLPFSKTEVLLASTFSEAPETQKKEKITKEQVQHDSVKDILQQGPQKETPVPVSLAPQPAATPTTRHQHGRSQSVKELVKLFDKPKLASAPRLPKADTAIRPPSPPALMRLPVETPVNKNEEVESPLEAQAEVTEETLVEESRETISRSDQQTPSSSTSALYPVRLSTSNDTVVTSKSAPMPSTPLRQRRSTSPLPKDEPFNMEVAWFAVNAQGALFTTMFSGVYSVMSRHLEWIALAFTKQLQKRKQSEVSPMTLKSALKIIFELELPITKKACRKLLLRLRDAYYQRRGLIPSQQQRGWSPTGKVARKWSKVTTSKMIQSQKDILAREFLHNIQIDFREVFVEALFCIGLKDVEQDPQVALLAFFDVYRFKDREYVLELLQYNAIHSPWKHYSNNTLQYLPSSSCASLGHFSAAEHLEIMPY